MPQDFNSDKKDPKIMKAGDDAAAARGEVKPFEVTTVYATDKLKATHKKGAPMEVHPALAEKLIETGKATAAEPKAEKDK